MKPPQTTDQHTKKNMDDFKFTHAVNCSAWRELEIKPYYNNNNNNYNNLNDDDHRVSSLECRNPKHNAAHVVATDHHLPNRVTSTTTSGSKTTTTVSWQNDYCYYDNYKKNNKKSKSTSSSSSSWINDAEVKRKKRIVKYKAYAIEGKVKASFRNGCRWVKNKYCELVYGY